MQPIDLLIKAAHIFTMQGDGVGYLAGGAIAVEQGRIVAVGPQAELAARYQPREVLDAGANAIFPGLIDGHMHTGLAIIRGVAQDTREWIHRGIGPYVPALDAAAMVAGSKLNALEAVRAGTTTLGDYGLSGMLEVCAFYEQLGVRARVTQNISEVPPVKHKLKLTDPYPWERERGEQKLAENMELVERFHGAGGGRITVMIAPQAPDMLSVELMEKCRRLAEEHDLGLHMHLAQGPRETIQMQVRYGKRSIPFMEELGYLDSRLLVAHITEATEDEVALLVERGVSLAACYGSQAIINGQMPPGRLFRQLGGNVTLGTDQAPGNNCNNIINEMKLAALLSKCRVGDPEVMQAWEVLRMATIEGARAIGLGHEIGSLEPGKWADLIVVDLGALTMMPVITSPVRNIVPNLVYAARGDEIQTVVVAGRVIYHQGSFPTVDVERIKAEAQRMAEAVGRRAERFFAETQTMGRQQMEKGQL